MSELFHTILLRVTLAGVASAVALRVVEGGALREIVKLAAGLLMLLALLQPLAGLRLTGWEGVRDGALAGIDVDAIQEQNAQTTMSTVAASIADALESSAQAKGFDCSVHVTMENDENGILQVGKVTVYYQSADAARLDELKTLVTEGCGVDADRQEWVAQ